VICQNLGMETPSSSVEHAHKLRDGVLVYFDDGRIAFFPASLLCAALPLAIEFENTDHNEGRTNVARIERRATHEEP
jgi:hypothetical protein